MDVRESLTKPSLTTSVRLPILLFVAPTEGVDVTLPLGVSPSIMARSKYPTLNRLLREVQEVSNVNPVDGLIGPNTERCLAEVLKGYDGNDILGYLADYVHQQVVLAPPISPSNPNNDHPLWLQKARYYIGTKEIKGSEHNETILRFWKLCHLPFQDDETAWCAGFVGGVLEESGIVSTRSGMARSYLKWGVSVKDDPPIGSVVVFWRGHKNSPSGHVGLLESKPTSDWIPTLGGNQGDMVCVKPYPASRVLDYRMPA